MKDDHTSLCFLLHQAQDGSVWGVGGERDAEGHNDPTVCTCQGDLSRLEHVAESGIGHWIKNPKVWGSIPTTGHV